MDIKLPESTQFVLKRLQKAGFEGYIVGGCVRDALMGKKPHDYDITTSATPEEIKALFSHTADTGIKHGTVTVIENGNPIEVTTFRTEGSYTDSRHPDCVEFVRDLKSDLARRDFTVNAICFSPATGIIDPFGGRDDIKAKKLQTVGNPDERFFEDALRILRLFRFCATLGFEIEQQTLTAAYKHSAKLSAVSCERITVELKKAVMGDSLEHLEGFIKSGALSFCNIHDCCAKTTNKLPKSQELRLFAFLFTSNNDIPKICQKLKLSNKTSRHITSLANLCELPIPKTKAAIKKLLNSFLPEILLDSLIYRGEESSIKLLNDILSSDEPYKISHLKLDGNELRAMGIENENIGITLNRLLELVIENPELNQKDKLLKLIQSN